MREYRNHTARSTGQSAVSANFQLPKRRQGESFNEWVSRTGGGPAATKNISTSGYVSPVLQQQARAAENNLKTQQWLKARQKSEGIHTALRDETKTTPYATHLDTVQRSETNIESAPTDAVSSNIQPITPYQKNARDETLSVFQNLNSSERDKMLAAPVEVQRQNNLQFESTLPGYTGYTALQFGAGALSTLQSLEGGIRQLSQDLVSGGQVSDDFQRIERFLQENPAEKDLVDRQGRVMDENVSEHLANRIGVNPESLRTYLIAREPERVSQSVEEAAQNLNETYRNIIGQGSYMLGQMAPGLLASAVLPASASGGIIGRAVQGARSGQIGGAVASAVKDAAKGSVASWMLGGSSLSQALQNNARQYGSKAGIYADAIANGFIESFSEGLFGFLDVPSVTRFLGTATGRGVTTFMRQLGRYLLTGSEEGLEEMVAGPLQSLSTKLFLDHDRKWFGEGGVFDAKQMLEDGVAGAAMGMVLGSAGAVISTYSALQESHDVRSAVNALNASASTLDEDIRPAPRDPNQETFESANNYAEEVTRGLIQQEQRLRQQALQASQAVNRRAQQQTEQPNVVNTNSTSGLVWVGSDLDRRTRLAATLPREQAMQFLQDAENGNIESAYQNAAADIQTPQTTRAANPGLIRDDSFRRAHYDARTERTLDTLAKAAGVSVRIVDKIPVHDADGNPIGMANARYHNGAIEIARNAKDPAGVAFTHEIVHRVRQADPEAYRAMARLVIDSLSDERYSGALDSRAQSYRDLDESNMQEELVADAFGRVLGDSEYLDRIVRQNRTVWQRILDTIRDFISRIHHVSSIGLNESERQEFSELAGRAEKMATLLENALDRAKTAQRIQMENAAQEDGAVKYSFGGVNAQNADLDALRRAKALQQQGTDMPSIFRETGWYIGSDGKWRFEIDDSGMEFRRDGDARLIEETDYQRMQELTEKWEQSFETGGALSQQETAELEELQEKYSDLVWEEKFMLRDFLKHDELFRAYPRLKGISLVFDALPDGVKGYFSPRSNTIVLSDTLFGKDADVLLHELQHIIQRYEGFAKGASPEYWAQRQNTEDAVGIYDRKIEQAFRQALDILDGLPQNIAEQFREWYNLDNQDPEASMRLAGKLRQSLYGEQFNDYLMAKWTMDNLSSGNYKRGANELYRNTAGEIEARNAAARRSMTPEQRRQTMPDTGDDNTVFAEETDEGGYFAMSADEQAGIREQLRENGDRLNAMEIVGRVNTQEYAGLDTRRAREKLVAEMKKTGYKVDRQGFGEIRFEESEINNSLNYKEKDPSAEDARRTGFLVLQNVLKRGIEIDSHDDHKGRNYDTVTIAAPVEINGERGNMAVVVKRTKGNRYKVHRILTPEGATFTLPEMANAEMNTVGAFTNGSQSLGGSAPAISSASMTSITQKTAENKEENLEPAELSLPALTEEDSQSRGLTADLAEDASNKHYTGDPDTRYSLMSSEISDMSNRLTEQLQSVNARADAGEITQEEATAQKMAILQAPIQELIAQYGQIEPGERPFRDIAIPRKTGDNMLVSRTVRTALEAEATPDELVPDIEELVAEGAFSYEAYGDEQAKKDSEQRIREIKFDAAKTEWERSIHKGRSSKFNTALGWTLYNEAANSGKTETAIQILTEMVGYQRDKAQALQAARILKQLSPDAQLYSATKAASDIQRDLDERHSRGNQYKLREESETAKRVGEAIQDARSDAAKALRDGDETFEQAIERELNRLFRRRKDGDAQTEAAKKDIALKVSEIVSDRNARKSARDAVISMLIEKYGVSEAEAAATAQIVGERFDTLVQESMQKRLDSIFKERQKPKRRTLQQRFEELANLGAFASEQYNEMAARRIVGDVPGIRIDPAMAEEFLNARTQDERDAIMKRIYMDIGRQMPSNFLDKWNAWRYFAMLANPRTHIRNIAGNTFFVPVVAAKNLTATAIESAVHFVSGGRTERGKAFVGASKSDRALLGAAWNDFSKVEDIISGVGKYEDSVSVQRSIQEGRRIFQSNNRLLNLIARPMEAARRGAGNLLTLEDMWFSKPHYAYALAQYCKAHGITEADIKAGNGLDAARAYAIKEAQKATYRDANALSQWLSDLGRAHGKDPVGRGVSMLVDGMLPFRATPANILVRGLEYSPAGLLNGIKQVLWDVRRGNMTAAQAIDSISAGLTGSGLAALGFWLAAQGLIRGHGSDDEEEEAFLEMLGHQQYALEIGGNSYTLDWLAPEAIPFLSGVNVFESALRSGGLREMTMEDWFGVVKLIGEPLMQMSFLQSINDVFDAVKYADSRNVNETVAAVASAATSYLMQGFPSFLGQIERASQADRMTTYTNPNAFLTTDMQYTLGSISARVPGLDYQQIPYIDAWGRKETEDSTAIRVRDNMFNPSYTDSYGETDLETELLRLYDTVGSSAVFPERADKSFKVNGEDLYLDADQYVKYATEKGKGALELATKIYESAEYKLLDDETKVEVISDAYAYANAIAKTKVSEYEPDGWVANALESGMKPEDYIIANAQLDNMSSFNAMIESGIDSETAFTVAQAISSLEPEKGEEAVSSMQKYKAVLHENLDEAEKVEALEYLMPNGTAEKFSTAVSYGIASEQYVDYMEHADANGNGSVTQKEAQDMISSISGLSQQQRAVLWQLQNKSWKSENNPFGYSGIQQEPESGGLTLGGGESTTERTTQSTSFGQLILGGK